MFTYKFKNVDCAGVAKRLDLRVPDVLHSSTQWEIRQCDEWWNLARNFLGSGVTLYDVIIIHTLRREYSGKNLASSANK